MSKVECAKYKISKCCRALLRRAVQLSEEDAGENQITRNLDCLKEFLDNTQYIRVQDLPYIIKLVYSVYDRCSHYEEYVPYLLRLLDICCFPPLLQKTSDILTYADDIIQHISMLGYIIVSTHNTEIRNCLCNGLERLFNVKTNHINCISQTFLNQMLAKSQLPVLVAEVMHMADDDLYNTLLVVVSNLLDSSDTRIVFLEKKIIELIFTRLVPADADATSNLGSLKPPINFKLLIEIVWKLCDAYLVASEPIKNRIGCTITKNAWEKVRILYRHLVKAKRYKKERNVLQKIVSHCAATTNVAYNFAFGFDMITVSCAPENGAVGTWAADVMFSNDEDDFDLKLLTMTEHGYFRRKPLLPSIYDEPNCLISMLRIITPEYQLIWTYGQRLKLIIHTLLCLECIMAHVLRDFVKYDAPRRLVGLYIKIFDGKLPNHYLTPCLRCIYRSLVEGAETVIADMYRSRGMIDLILSYIKITLIRSPLTMEDQVLLITIFCTLYHLNKDYMCLNERVVPTCIDCIKRFQKPSDKDCFLDPRVMLALLDYMWEHLKWDECSTDLFVQCGGVYLLFDVLERSPIAVKLVALNILVDLTQQGITFPFIATWRGRNGISGIKLLLDVFRQSNFDNDSVTAEGVIKDPQFPLMGKRQCVFTFNQLDYSECSPACLDFLGSTRPKVHALLLMIQCSPSKHLLREHFKAYNTELSKLDRVLAVLAENYMPLKMYEVWSELDMLVRHTGRRVIIFDQCVIKYHVERSHKWALLIQRAQNDILRSRANEELTREKNFYQNLRDQTLSDALTTLDEMILFGNTMDRTFRKKSKRKQTSQIRNSTRPHIDSSFNFHVTVMHGAAFTRPFKQCVSIRSNVVIDPNKPEEIKPVSESTSIENQHNAMHVENSSNADIGNFLGSGLLSGSGELIL